VYKRKLHQTERKIHQNAPELQDILALTHQERSLNVQIEKMRITIIPVCTGIYGSESRFFRKKPLTFPVLRYKKNTRNTTENYLAGGGKMTEGTVPVAPPLYSPPS